MVNNGPTVYNTSSVYAEAGGGEPFTKNLPADTYLIEYVEFSGVSGGGYFDYTTNDNFIIGPDDNIYLKYFGNFNGYGWTTLFSCFVDNGTNRITWEIVSNSMSRLTNGGTGSGWAQFGVTVPNVQDFLFVKRTKNGLYTTWGNFSLGTTSWGTSKMYLDRPYNTKSGIDVKLYPFVITDKNDIVKFYFYPIFNTQNNKIGIWEKYTNTIKYPNTQTGLMQGPKIEY